MLSLVLVLAHRVYKDVELLALSHEAADLRRANLRARLGLADRAVFPALMRRLPTRLRADRVPIAWSPGGVGGGAIVGGRAYDGGRRR